MTLWLVFGGTSRQNKRINLDLEPCPTIMADGVGGYAGEVGSIG